MVKTLIIQFSFVNQNLNRTKGCYLVTAQFRKALRTLFSVVQQFEAEFIRVQRSSVGGSIGQTGAA